MLRKAFAGMSGIISNSCTYHGLMIHIDDLKLVLDFVTRGGEVLILRERVEDISRKLARVDKEQEVSRGQTDADIPMPFFFQ